MCILSDQSSNLMCKQESRSQLVLFLDMLFFLLQRVETLVKTLLKCLPVWKCGYILLLSEVCSLMNFCLELVYCVWYDLHLYWI